MEQKTKEYCLITIRYGRAIPEIMSINEARPIMRESEIKHRHVSHLYGLHPCSEISPLKTPELAEFVICGTKPKNVLVAGKDMTASFTFDGTKSYLN